MTVCKNCDVKPHGSECRQCVNRARKMLDDTLCAVSEIANGHSAFDQQPLTNDVVREMRGKRDRERWCV